MKVNELIEQLKHTYENCNILKSQYVRESIKEAISIMESLQGQIAEYEKAINCKSCDCNICIAHKNNLKLRAQLAESQRRADAAVEDMKRINGLDMRSELEMCRFCKFGVDKHCRKCDFGKMTNNFEWRGLQDKEVQHEND